MGRRSFRGRRRARVTWSPHIFTMEGLAPVTADTAVNTTIYSNGETENFHYRAKSMNLTVTAGASTTSTYWILRKIPAGYTAPSATITTGETSFTDEAGVLGWGHARSFSTNTAQIRMSQSWRRKVVVCAPGDSIVLQLVSNASSASLSVDGIHEFGLHGN